MERSSQEIEAEVGRVNVANDTRTYPKQVVAERLPKPLRAVAGIVDQQTIVRTSHAGDANRRVSGELDITHSGERAP